MSVDTKLPGVNPPPSAGSEPSSHSTYGNIGGYYDLDNRRTGPGGGLTGDPLVGFKIDLKRGEFYWEVIFVYNPHWDNNYTACIYHTQDNADWNDLSDEEKEAVYEKAILIWEVTNDSSADKKISVHERIIEEKYRNGFFFLRVKRKDKLGRPTACLAFPTASSFVIPDKIKNLQIEESPYYVNNYTAPISCITISYEPPDNMVGFWGVKVYIQGYQGDNEIRELTIKRYDKTKGVADVFNIFLEPYIDIFAENQPIGQEPIAGYYWDWNEHMTGLKRGIILNYVEAGGVQSEELSAELVAWTVNQKWKRQDPEIKGLNEIANIGDSIILNAYGSGPNIYAVEGIIKKFDDIYFGRKFYIKLKNMPSAINPDIYMAEDEDNPGIYLYPYLNWKIMKSCKIYVIAINKYGFHGDLEAEALSDYVALDGLESAPLPPQEVKAFQNENQNTISFQYNLDGWQYDDIECFNIYRIPYADFNTVWEKIATIKAKSKNEQSNDKNNLYESYYYIDGEMASLTSYSKTYEYAAGIRYGVSTQDKNGFESLIRVAQHYLIDGTLAEYIPFRRGTGSDHSPIVLVRNNAFNLFYNSEAIWDYNYSADHIGYGNPHYNEWAIWDKNYAHPAVLPAGASLTASWDNSNKRFVFNFSNINSRDCWFKLITQQTSVGTTPPYFAPDYPGLGRTKIIIPSMNYYAHIGGISYSGYYLYLYLREDQRPPFSANYIFNNNEYIISIAPFTGDLTTPSVISIMPIGSDYTCFRNGWIYDHTEAGYDFWDNGYFFVPSPSLSTGKCSYSQRIRKTYFYPGQDITCSFWCKRLLSGVASSYGVCGLSIGGMTNYISDFFPYSSPSIGADSTIFDLAEISTEYTYVVLYSKIPNYTPTEWNNINYINIALIFEWEANDLKVSYNFVRPMLNFGNEAAPYTPRNYLEHFSFANPGLPSDNPPAQDEEDPMCVEENQYIMMADGSYIQAKNIKIGMVLKGYKNNNIVQSVSKNQRGCLKIILENNKSIIISTTHNCYFGENKEYLHLKKAKDLVRGLKMYDVKEDKMLTILDIEEIGRKNIVKISTNYPHHIIVNDILTHNIKAGGGA